MPVLVVPYIFSELTSGLPQWGRDFKLVISCRTNRTDDISIFACGIRGRAPRVSEHVKLWWDREGSIRGGYLYLWLHKLNHSGVDNLIGYLFICLWTIEVFFPCEIHICFCFFFLGGRLFYLF